MNGLQDENQIEGICINEKNTLAVHDKLLILRKGTNPTYIMNNYI